MITTMNINNINYILMSLKKDSQSSHKLRYMRTKYRNVTKNICLAFSLVI